jgi:hypothetical protein
MKPVTTTALLDPEDGGWQPPKSRITFNEHGVTPQIELFLREELRGTLRRRWEDNIKLDLAKMGW